LAQKINETVTIIFQSFSVNFLW